MKKHYSKPTLTPMGLLRQVTKLSGAFLSAILPLPKLND